MQLRSYQVEAVENLREQFRQGAKNLLLYAPTGSGKTVIASEIMKGAVEKGSRVVFVAHRRELISQCSDKLHAFGVPHGIILAGEEASPYDAVQVASIQTLHTRAFRSKRLELPPAEVVVIDEAHHAISKTYRDVANAYPEAAVIGLTATPVRGDGKGLGHIFESMVEAPSIKELTRMGYLVPIRYYAPSIPDLWGVKVRAGDYVPGELAEKMDRPKLIGDIITEWSKVASDRKTVVFASSVAHSVHIKEQFMAEGVRAAHVDGNTPKDERDDMLADLKAGRIQVIVNCAVLTEGWDQPDVSCCVLARPTKSLGLYLQMAGRVLRPAPGKTDTILIDHSGAVYEHGFVDEDFCWSLDDSGKISDREQKRKESEPRPITCGKCFTVYRGQRVCPSCGAVPEPRGRDVSMAEGSLSEVRGGKAKRREYSQDDKQKWYQEIRYIQVEKGRKTGWAAHTFKKKFGHFPPFAWNDLPVTPASLEVERYVKHLAVKYYKGREKGQRDRSLDQQFRQRIGDPNA